MTRNQKNPGGFGNLQDQLQQKIKQPPQGIQGAYRQEESKSKAPGNVLPFTSGKNDNEKWSQKMKYPYPPTF